jgi:hypothetical protein
MLAVGAMVMCCSTSLLAAETETPCAEGSPTCRKPWSGFRESLVLGLDVGGGSVTTTNDLSNASGAKATKFDAAPWLRGTADVAGVGRTSERGVMTMFTVGLSLTLN